jgi:simple sugar transport system ATP-binding protein
MIAPRLELRAITKCFPSVIANEDISLSVQPGEIHAVLGENGAGKSTLMKIIYGALVADSGEILIDGQAVSIANPAAARALGIGMVYQHFSLFESVSVAENIAAALNEPYDLKALGKRIFELGQRYQLPIEPEQLVHHLSVGERQRVEIIRCLLQKPKLLILDEPTSVLSPQAVQHLFGVLRALAVEGVSILYISHKLDEIIALCSKATILRGGKLSGSVDPRQVTKGELACLMVGSVIPQVDRPALTRSDKPLLEAIGLNLISTNPFGTALHNVSFDLWGGEILGFAGISGNGQAELLSALSGDTPVDSQSIWMDQNPVGDLSVAARRALGLAFVPEERLGRGAVPDMSLAQNTLLTNQTGAALSFGFINAAATGRIAQKIIDQFSVKCSGPGAIARVLSGGNLQKFIMGREIGLAPRVLIVAQPTWGVDVAAAAFIRQKLVDLSRAGTAVLIISEELDELFEISDRIAVLCRGHLSPALETAKTNRHAVGLLMAGGDAPISTAA